MNVTIRPCTLRGRVQAPPSKSYAHRMLICAALAEGESRIHGISGSEDMYATMECVEALGGATAREGDTVTVTPGRGGELDGAVFPCRESGSTLRFFIPLALARGGSTVFTGTGRLMARGVDVYEELFARKGLRLTRDAGSIAVSGRLCSGEYTLRGDVSSQFVSGLLFALPLLEGDSTIHVLPPVESRRYIDITVDAMAAFGVAVEERERNTFFVPGGQRYRPRELQVEGDWSNAAALYGLNALGAELEITGLNGGSIQGDRACVEILQRLEQPGSVTDLSGCPDLGPVLFAVAAAKHGGVFTGTRRLRIKESDRARAMADELKKFGVDVHVEENSVTVADMELRPPREALSGHNDHRIVMAMTLLATLCGGEIGGAEAIRKSYPDFFEVLKGLGLETEYGD